MRIVITGASGQVGSELKDLLLEDKEKECYFLDRKQLPLDQIQIIQEILAVYQPDLIIHAGAYTAVDKAEEDQVTANLVNHLACEEIAQYCHINHTRLIAISTDYVFDGTSNVALTEMAATAPINVYGETKLAGEQAIQKWCPEAIIIRTSWVYSSYGKNFVKTMCRLMAERDEVNVINDQIGSPTYAKDLAAAILKIADSSGFESGIYNYSNEGAVSWYDFAVAIRDFRSFDCQVNPIPTSAYPTPARRPKYSLLDKSKIKDTFAVEVPEWEKSLANMLAEEFKN
ncbi:dTDP-4-dehydrorhamnose reductase [Sphingobacterium multivorum]|uniref:dTDP-4-dehydrorhamnose reductase n=1 Tax=Sphingobacterium multivorum TaxID=28454 RepID=A0ABX7CSH4_SPHMU|nr:dTDP-4-dehydrorhamnose reductase [Sphingobacterium multivorum]QQT53122.1 dTDP-4-dehydrorhamnose reductase [Sphingobacterium multivorum]